MQFSASRAFSDAFGTFTRRFGPMAAITILFIVAEVALLFVFGASLMTLFASSLGPMTAGGAEGATSPAALGGGMLGSIFLFYLLVYSLQFAHQSALCRLCSSNHDATIGDAISAGVRSVPTLLGVAVLMMIAAFGVSLVLGIVIGIVVAAGQSPAMAFVGGLVIFVGLVWLAARLCMILPVVANEDVRNPITAIGRAWRMTSGHALKLALLFIAVFFAMGVVILLVFFAALGGMPTPGNLPSMGSLITIGVLMLVLSLSVGLYFVALVTAIHGQLSDTSAEAISDTFA